MYLLDTDILVNLLRPVPSTGLITRLASVPPNEQFTSSITLGELVYGAYRLKNHTATLLEKIEILFHNLPVLPFDVAAAHQYGQLRAERESRGTPVGDADLRIAATALVSGLKVVTGNIRHFQRIPGLSVENWLSD